MPPFGLLSFHPLSLGNIYTHVCSRLLCVHALYSWIFSLASFRRQIHDGCLLVEGATCVFHSLLWGSPDLVLLPDQLFDLGPYLLMTHLGHRTGVSAFILPSFLLPQFPTSWFLPSRWLFFPFLSSPPVSLPSFQPHSRQPSHQTVPVCECVRWFLFRLLPEWPVCKFVRWFPLHIF